MAFMTGQETDLIKLDRDWQNYPIPTIIRDFDVPEAVKQTLLIDAAEHVIPIMERRFGLSGLAREIIRQSRVILHGNESREAKNRLSELLDMLCAKLTDDRYIKRKYYPIQHVFSAVHYAAQRLGARVLNTNFDSSCLAAAWDAAPMDPSETPTLSEAWKRAHREQELWVISHFVDLMNALYDAVRQVPIEPHK
jgi:hypothetical protein